MNATPKTDECIKMMGEAQIVFSPLHYSDSGCFDKNIILAYQERIRAMLDYRLMPFCEVSMPNDCDKESLKTFLLENRINTNNLDSRYYVMKNYSLVTADDLKKEFWNVCPDLESVPKYLDVMGAKFDVVNCNYNTDIGAIKEEYKNLDELVGSGEISRQEADEMLWNLHFIARRYNFVIDCIRNTYKEFIKMTKAKQTDISPLTPILTIPDSILKGLQQEKYIENVTERPIKWLKDLQDLNAFINVFYPNKDKKWVRTVNTFTDNGEQIKIDSIKNLNPAYKDDPISKQYFKKLKAEIKER